MYSRDAFVEEFAKLLAKIPKDTSFRQLQFDYRQVAFSMGQEILARFPEIIVGKEPCKDEPMAFRMAAPGPGGGRSPIVPANPAGGTGGPTIGPYPHELCHYVCWIINS
jgi:hypothetical protein